MVSYGILFTLFFVVLAVSFGFNLSAEVSEYAAFGTLFGFLAIRRAIVGAPIKRAPKKEFPDSDDFAETLRQSGPAPIRPRRIVLNQAA